MSSMFNNLNVHRFNLTNYINRTIKGYGLFRRLGISNSFCPSVRPSPTLNICLEYNSKVFDNQLRILQMYEYNAREYNIYPFPLVNA